MHVVIEEKKYLLNEPFSSGGEGEVYKLTDDTSNLQAVKIYHSNVLSAERKQKVLSLCNAYLDNIDKFGGNNFAFPKNPAYEKNFLAFDEVVGFSMPLFTECPHINDLNYDTNSSSFKEVNGKRFDNNTCIAFIYKLFEIVDKLHNSRIVLGDVNPGNILCQGTRNQLQPVLIDLDAVQYGNFDCTEFYKQEFLDPDLERNGKNASDRYIYSSSSDIFSLTVLCYNLWVGIYPYFIRTRPSTLQSDPKLNNLSVLRYLVEGADFLTSANKEYLKAQNQPHESRLIDLKKIDNVLYDFFVSILVKGQRKNLLTFLPQQDKRRSSNPYMEKVVMETGLGKVINKLVGRPTTKKPYKPKYVIPKAKVITRTQIKDTDPDEFVKFLSGYGIDITQGDIHVR